jgi:hypothetical protein
MKMLLHGEGPTDCGKKDAFGKWIDGPIQIMMRKINNALEIDCKAKNEIKNVRLQRSIKGIKGHGISAAKLAVLANTYSYDIVALYRDADNRTGYDAKKGHACKKLYSEIKKDIYNGFKQSSGKMKFIAVIPVKMIENWLLADSKGFEKAFKGKCPELPKNPELIWGDEANPDSNHPKKYMERVLSAYREEANIVSFCLLAENINIDTLTLKCPISFGDFHKQMREGMESPGMHKELTESVNNNERTKGGKTE